MPTFYRWFIPVILSVIPLFAGAQTDSAKSCSTHCCCPTDPTPAGVMISHIHPKGQWMLSYRYMSMDMGSMVSGTQQISDNEVYQNYVMSADQMRMDMHMLMVMYGLTNRLTLMGMFNYNTVSMQMSMLPGGMQMMNMPGMTMSGNGTMDMSMQSGGIGDFKINALYGLMNRTNHHLLLSAGVSVPVGSADIKGESNSMYPNQRLPYDMQSGSGSWDLLPGINYMYQRGRITFSSQVTAVIRTGYNSLGYKLGNEATCNNWLSLLWGRSFSTSVRLEGYTSGMINGQDATLYAGNEPAANPYNYGGQRISGYLGSNYFFRKGIFRNNKIGAEYGVPFYQYLNGIQMHTSAVLYASWSILF